jgi:heme/copper-type cytochrome/quinol oxidase subunit 2
MKKKLFIIPVIITIIGALLGLLAGLSTPKPVSRNIVVKARQYAYEPEHINANKGDTLNINLVSMDVTHGFYVEGYDIDAQVQSNLATIKFRHPSQGYKWQDTNMIVIIANKTGKFRYRCSHTCGTMHPFMQGELIVNPNNTLHAGLGGTIGFMAGMLLMIFMKNKQTGGK